MLLHHNNVCNLLREFTGCQIEKTALAEVTDYLEKLNRDKLKEIALQSLIERNKLNMKREQKGEYRKSRIDQECINNAIKTKKQKRPSQPEILEGKTKEKEDVEKYNKVVNFVDKIGENK